jgi:hypothetical protein
MLWGIPLTLIRGQGQFVVRVRVSFVAKVRFVFGQGYFCSQYQIGLDQDWNQPESVSGLVCGHGCGQSEVTVM